MVLNKLAIGLIAGIGSVAAVGGLTAGVVVSRNNTVIEVTNEADEANSKEADKANRSSTNRDSLMADESKTASTDISSAMTTKESDAKKMSQADEKPVEQQVSESSSQDEETQTGVISDSSRDNDATSQDTTNVETQQPVQNLQEHQGETAARQDSSGPSMLKTLPAQSTLKESEESGRETTGENIAPEGHSASVEGEDEPQDL